jgi:hypothetical protein
MGTGRAGRLLATQMARPERGFLVPGSLAIAVMHMMAL